MGRKEGNPGNKGGGRKSAYQERADAETLHRMYFDTAPQEEIEEKIRQGKASLKDRHILVGLEGDARVLNTIFNKVFPDKIIQENTGAIKHIVSIDE